MTTILKKRSSFGKVIILISLTSNIGGCISNATPYRYDSVNTYHRPSYTEDNEAIEQELLRLRSESRRLKYESKAAHNHRLEKIKGEQARLLLLQQKNIHRQNQRQHNIYERNHRKKETRKGKNRRDYEHKARADLAHQAQARAYAQSQAHAQEVKRDADRAERKHVAEIFRQQEENRRRQQAASGVAPKKLNKSEKIQKQIDDDHELAKKIAEEEFLSTRC